MTDKIQPCNTCARSERCPALDALLTKTTGAFPMLARLTATGVHCEAFDLSVGSDGYVSECRLNCWEYKMRKIDTAHVPGRWRPGGHCEGCSKRDEVVFELTDKIAVLQGRGQ